MLIKRLLILLGVIFIYGFFVKNAFASVLYLSPGKGNIGQGTVLSVQVRLNTQGDAVNGVSAYLSYPADKLDVAWVSGGGSFAIDAERVYGGGIVKVSRGSINPVSGNLHVATIGFRGKALGSANVGFIGGSAAPRAADSSDSLNLGGSPGGSYSVVPFVPKTKEEIEAEAIKFTNIEVTAISTDSAIIKWKTDKKTDSNVEYGLEKDKYVVNVTDSKSTTEHSLKLEGPLTSPGLILHFRIKAKNDEGNISSSDDNIVHLKGYRVKIQIVDQNNKPLTGAYVYFYSSPQKSITDSEGNVAFSDVTIGKHLVLVKWKSLEKVFDANVKESANLENSLNFKIDTQSLPFSINVNNNVLYAAIGINGILFAIEIILLVIYFRHKNKT